MTEPRFDHDDPVSEVLAARTLKAYDDPANIEAPAGFNYLEATTRFLQFAHAFVSSAGIDADVEVWPALAGATFHGSVELPPSAMTEPESASVRASNFGNLITIEGAAEAVRPALRAALLRAFEARGYRYVPPALLRRSYDGRHAGTASFRRWGDRFFGYPR